MGKMKVAVASDDEKKIADHFGRAKGFKIFEINFWLRIRRSE